MLVLLGLVLVAAGDGEDDRAARLKVDRFDSAAAWRLLEYQVELGPRPAGTETSKQLAEWLRERLPNGRPISKRGKASRWR